MNISLSFTLFLIFLSLSMVHFHWALGGHWGFDQALPTTEDGQKIINPRPVDSAIVGFGLLLFGLFYLMLSEVIPFYVPTWILKVGSWIIPIIFILRAVGDFKYVGFFKKIQSTEFAKWDSLYYSPLCLLIAAIAFTIIRFK